MIVYLHHLEFLSLKGGCRGSSESTLVKCQDVGNLMLGLNYYCVACNAWVTQRDHVCVGDVSITLVVYN